MKVEELRGNNLGELQETLIALLKERFNLRMQMATGQLGQNHTLKQTRRDIARVKTVINQKKRKGADL